MRRSIGLGLVILSVLGALLTLPVSNPTAYTTNAAVITTLPIGTNYVPLPPGFSTFVINVTSIASKFSSTLQLIQNVSKNTTMTVTEGSGAVLPSLNMYNWIQSTISSGTYGLYLVVNGTYDYLVILVSVSTSPITTSVTTDQSQGLLPPGVVYQVYTSASGPAVQTVSIVETIPLAAAFGLASVSPLYGGNVKVSTTVDGKSGTATLNIPANVFQVLAIVNPSYTNLGPTALPNTVVGRQNATLIVVNPVPVSGYNLTLTYNTMTTTRITFLVTAANVTVYQGISPSPSSVAVQYVIFSNGTVKVTTNIYNTTTTTPYFIFLSNSSVNVGGKIYTSSLASKYHLLVNTYVSGLSTGSTTTVSTSLKAQTNETTKTQIDGGWEFNVTPNSTLITSFVTPITLYANGINTTFAKAAVNIIGAFVNFTNLTIRHLVVYNFTVTPNLSFLKNVVNSGFSLSALYNNVSGLFIVYVNATSVAQKVIHKAILSAGETGVPFTGTSTQSLTVSLVSPPSLGYISLVEFGLWNNFTTVYVNASYRSSSGKNIYAQPVQNYFYAMVIPPSFISLPPAISSVSAQCLQLLVKINAPDAVLYPYGPSPLNSPSVTGPWDMSGSGLVAELVVGSTVVATTSPVFLVPNPAVGFETSTYVIYIQAALAPSDSISSPSDNTVVVHVKPQDAAHATVVLIYNDSDFANQYLFSASKLYMIQATLPFITGTASLALPAVSYLYSPYIYGNISDFMYQSAEASELVLQTSSIPPPAYLFLPIEGYQVWVGYLQSINVTGSGISSSIVLSASNMSTLFQSLFLKEYKTPSNSCTGLYPFAISTSGLEKVLGVSATALNGSRLYITYYDAITNRNVTASTLLLLSKAQTVNQSPIRVEYIFAERFISPLVGYNLSIPTGNVYNGFVTLLDTNLAKQNPTSILSLQVYNLLIKSSKATLSITYNPSNGMSRVLLYVGGSLVKNFTFSGVISTLRETGPGTGIFNGSLATFTVPAGSLTASLQNLNLVLPNGTAVPLTYVQYFANPFLNSSFPYITSNVTATVIDPFVGVAFTVNTQMIPVVAEPIRLSLYGLPVSQLQTSNLMVYGVAPGVYTITPSSPNIVLNVSSIINYPAEFFVQVSIYQGIVTPLPTGVLPGNATFVTTIPVPIPYYAPGLKAHQVVPFYVNIGKLAVVPPGQYTIAVFAVGFAGGAPISEFPTVLYVHANITF